MVAEGRVREGADLMAPTVEALLAKHEKSIRRFLGRRSGPHVLQRTTLDDLYQETVAIAIRKAVTFEYRDDASFLAWANTIARIVVLESLSDRRRRPPMQRIKGLASTGVGVPEGVLCSAGSTPSSVVAGRENRVALKHAIEGLPEDQQRVITLYKLEGRSIDEVSAQMRRTKGATCQLIARAMEKLRTLLLDE